MQQEVNGLLRFRCCLMMKEWMNGDFKVFREGLFNLIEICKGPLKELRCMDTFSEGSVTTYKLQFCGIHLGCETNILLYTILSLYIGGYDKGKSYFVQ